MKTYKNPKTGSVYNVVIETKQFIMGVRKLNDGTTNRRIQIISKNKNKFSTLYLKEGYFNKYQLWEVKESEEHGKYLTITVSVSHLHNAIADAVRGIVRYNLSELSNDIQF